MILHRLARRSPLMRRPFPIIAILLAALALGPAGVAWANAHDNTIAADCSHSSTGLLTHTYPRAELRHALNNLPGDIQQYSGCYDAIKQALVQSGRSRPSSGGSTNGTSSGATNSGGSTGGGGGTSGGSPTGGTASSSGGSTSGAGSAGSGTGSPSSSGAGASAGSAASGPATGAPVPSHSGTSAPVRLADTQISPGTLPAISRDGHALPTPVIVFLALLGAGGLVLGGSTIGRRVLARRRP